MIFYQKLQDLTTRLLNFAKSTKARVCQCDCRVNYVNTGDFYGTNKLKRPYLGGASQKKFLGKKFDPPKIWRPPENLETPRKFGKIPPEKLETRDPPSQNIGDPPKNWWSPPKFGDPEKLVIPRKIGGFSPPRDQTSTPPPDQTPHPAVDRQTPVNSLPWPNFVAAGNNLMAISITARKVGVVTINSKNHHSNAEIFNFEEFDGELLFCG